LPFNQKNLKKQFLTWTAFDQPLMRVSGVKFKRNAEIGPLAKAESGVAPASGGSNSASRRIASSNHPRAAARIAPNQGKSDQIKPKKIFFFLLCVLCGKISSVRFRPSPTPRKSAIVRFSPIYTTKSFGKYDAHGNSTVPSRKSLISRIFPVFDIFFAFRNHRLPFTLPLLKHGLETV
jgi:hypothetical protein